MNTDSKNKKKPPVILFFGPTASGKSDLILDVFGSRFEIINSDSQQVYKYLDIGTAKPDKAAMERVPHHLVSICDPKQQFNSGEFVKQANLHIDLILKRHKIPLISGGTGFYIKNFIYGMPETPPSDPEIREKLQTIAQKKGLPCLYKRLEDVDRDYARRIDQNDTLRIIRALEVFEISGKPLSLFHIPARERDDLAMYKIGLSLARPELHKRIERRVEQMFDMGLIDEVRSLIERGYSLTDPGMKSIGYREFFMMQTGCFSFDDVKEFIKASTRQYAKRQITFFKAFENVCWFHPDDHEGIRKGINEFLEKIIPDSSSG
ncbi:MAG: tRNA (adenosine(37)-N6)-dimethylallyltransferase MiaA [Spirochaetales bacterium]|nr:tRNA (adenosine(37)-N6)-dimethylallyltransferase MiaA [Spirochaetales bacterium]